MGGRLMEGENYMVHHENLKSYVKDIFTKVGLAESDAQLIASHLVAANLRGVDSHGVSRVPIYVQRIESGLVNRENDVKIIKESDNSALIDGNNSQGILIAQQAIEMGVKKAKTSGVAIIGVQNSNHCGMLAYYSKYAIQNDCIALITSNASPSMPPWGGRERYFGTNPFCYGIPTGNEIDIIFDMATSVVARGKIRLAAKYNQTIPVGWAINEEGKQTTDPLEALSGLVLPFGGPKGYGLVFFIDVISAILTGANSGPNVGSIVEPKKQGLGHYFLVMRADLFQPLDAFKSRMDQTIRKIRSVNKMDGVDRIFLPGEIECELEQERLQSGVPIAHQLFNELLEIGMQYDLNIKDYLT